MQQANPDFHFHISGRRLHIHEDGASYLVTKQTYRGISVVPIAMTNVQQPPSRKQPTTAAAQEVIHPIASIRQYFSHGTRNNDADDYGSEFVISDGNISSASSVSMSSVPPDSVMTNHFIGITTVSATSQQKPAQSIVTSVGALPPQFGTPATKFVVVPDIKQQPPQMVTAIASNIAYINQDWRIYRNETFNKVHVTAAPPQMFLDVRR